MFVWMEQNSLDHISLFLVLFKRSREPNIKFLLSPSPNLTSLSKEKMHTRNNTTRLYLSEVLFY